MTSTDLEDLCGHWWDESAGHRRVMGECDRSCKAERLSLEELRPGPAVRSGPLDRRHVAALAENLDETPPVLVACPSRRLLDGHHRVAAARRRGDTDIAVTWWHGSDDEMFTIAVERNTTHGIPLSLKDRRSAAKVHLWDRPAMSDRSIAKACGLAPSTVGIIRREMTGLAAHPGTVTGLDGKSYPVEPQGPSPAPRLGWVRRVLRRLSNWWHDRLRPRRLEERGRSGR